VKIDIRDVVGSRLGDATPIEVDLRPATAEESEKFFVDVEDVVSRAAHAPAGKHRLRDWANGWQENLLAFRLSRNPLDMTPRYFGKYPEIRLGGRLFLDASGRAEQQLLHLLQSAAIAHAKKLVPFTSVCEFGAGTGHNLLNIGKDETLTSLRGFEWSWSGVTCINELGKHIDPRISGRFFDYFEPEIGGGSGVESSCVVTVASLEQISDAFRPFLAFLRKARPAVVINIEPIQELMGSDRFGDLSREYAHRRGYLSGYLDYLENLERAGMLEILLKQDSLIGSKFLNGYGTVIWRWLNQ
jgi:hypothetical protein